MLYCVKLKVSDFRATKIPVRHFAMSDDCSRYESCMQTVAASTTIRRSSCVVCYFILRSENWFMFLWENRLATHTNKSVIVLMTTRFVAEATLRLYVTSYEDLSAWTSVCAQLFMYVCECFVSLAQCRNENRLVGVSRGWTRESATTLNKSYIFSHCTAYE